MPLLLSPSMPLRPFVHSMRLSMLVPVLAGRMVTVLDEPGQFGVLALAEDRINVRKMQLRKAWAECGLSVKRMSNAHRSKLSVTEHEPSVSRTRAERETNVGQTWDLI